MAGLLDFLQTPQGMGLLSGVASYAANARRGQPVNSIGRGLVGGLTGYAQANDMVKQDEENAFQKRYRQMQMDEMQRKIDDQTAMRESGKAAFGKATIQPRAAVAPYTMSVPTMGGKPSLMAGMDAAMGGDFAQQPLLGPMESMQMPGQEAQAGGFDPAVYKQEYMQRLAQAGMFDEAAKFAPKDVEYGTTPFVDADGNVQLIGKTGTTKTLPFKGQKKEGASPYGQDMREYLAVQGIDPETATPQQLRDAHAYVNREKLTRAKAQGVNIGPTTVMAEGAADRAGKKIGDIVGEQTATIEGQYSALDAVRGARKQLEQGIYSGYWANAGMAAAKATSGAIGDRDKAARTEKFKSYIGNTVIPRLKEFGGNDSVEELRMLERVMGGDITLEPEALSEIMASIETKQMRGIERMQRQQQAIESGKVPGTDPGTDRARKEQEGQTGVSRSGKPMVYRNGQWEYI